MSQKTKIDVRMLGGLEFSVNGEQCHLSGSQNSKTAHFLALLMYAYPLSVAREEAAEALYYASEADSDNSLKTLVFRVRKSVMSDFKIDDKNVIMLESGKYSFSPDIEVNCDAVLFQSLYTACRTESDPERRLANLRKAASLYRGELLPRLSDAQWVIYENTKIGDQYCKVVKALGKELCVRQEYEEAYQTYKKALMYFPYDEDFMSETLNVLLKLGKHKQALVEYEEMTSVLFDELGVYPSERLMSIMRRIGDSVAMAQDAGDKVHQALNENEAIGAYYCNYPSFVDSYHILNRIRNREQIEASLVLFTVVDAKGHPLEKTEQVVSAISILRMVLAKTLRKSDMYTRFSKSQILVMFWNMPKSNVDIALTRIQKAIRQDDAEGICLIVASALDSPTPPSTPALDTAAIKKKNWQPIK